jgi:hypothetical protein
MFWQTKHYYNLETGLHNELKQYRQNNEFFQCSYDIIETALSTYLSQQSRDYIFDDAVLIPAQSRNLKWFEKEKIFTIDKNIDFVKIQIKMNEDVLMKEIENWIFLFGNIKLLKFAHSSFWEKYLWMLKSNFAVNDDSASAKTTRLQLRRDSIRMDVENIDDEQDFSEDLSTLFSQFYF